MNTKRQMDNSVAFRETEMRSSINISRTCRERKRDSPRDNSKWQRLIRQHLENIGHEKRYTERATLCSLDGIQKII